MKYSDIDMESLENVLDDILNDGVGVDINEDLMSKIFIDDALDEDMGSAVDEFLAVFDKKASAAIKTATLKKLAKKHGVDPKELLDVVGG